MTVKRQKSPSRRPRATRPKAKKAKGRTRDQLISLSGAAAFFRVPSSGNPPSRGLLLYHLGTGALAPDKTTQLVTQNVYGFKRSTLQAFARSVGWQYVGKGA